MTHLVPPPPTQPPKAGTYRARLSQIKKYTPRAPFATPGVDEAREMLEARKAAYVRKLVDQSRARPPTEYDAALRNRISDHDIQGRRAAGFVERFGGYGGVVGLRANRVKGCTF